MAELDLDAWRRVVKATWADSAAWQVRHDLAESAFGHRLLAQIPAVVATLERSSELASELAEAQSESEDARRIMAAAQERAERLEVAAGDVVRVFGDNPKYFESSPWLGKIRALMALRAALAAAPGEERG